MNTCSPVTSSPESEKRKTRFESKGDKALTLIGGFNNTK